MLEGVSQCEGECLCVGGYLCVSLPSVLMGDVGEECVATSVHAHECHCHMYLCINM